LLKGESLEAPQFRQRMEFRLDAVEVDTQINIAHLSNVIMVALGGKF
jgi:hypothetical protein